MSSSKTENRRPDVQERGFVRPLAIWRRNVRVWRKLMWPSILGNFGEPLLYLLAFGYGFGRLVGAIDEMPYMVFLASGIVCSNAMTTASFESMYSAFTRMTQQLTWGSMLDAPLTVDDIVTGEIVWSATKSVMSGTAILLVAVVLGLVGGWQAILVLPMILLMGLCFGACAMVVTAVSPSYDFFLYYFTLVMTPMVLLSGVFFPLDQLPSLVGQFAFLLPLAHGVEIVRPLMTGGWPDTVFLHLLVIAGYGLAGWVLSIRILRKRLAS